MEAPKVKRIQKIEGYRPVYFENGAQTSAAQLALMEDNFGITQEQTKTMSRDEFETWRAKLFWLTNRVENDFTRYDICKEMFGLCYDDVIAMSPIEFMQIYKQVETEWKKRRKEMIAALPDE